MLFCYTIKKMGLWTLQTFVKDIRQMKSLGKIEGLLTSLKYTTWIFKLEWD